MTHIMTSYIWTSSYEGLKILTDKSMVYGLLRIDSISLCERSIYGKQTRKTFPIEKAKRVSHRLELIHVDLCELMQTKSLGWSIYFLLFTDDYTRMS